MSTYTDRREEIKLFIEDSKITNSEAEFMFHYDDAQDYIKEKLIRPINLNTPNRINWYKPTKLAYS